MAKWTTDDIPDQTGRTILITGANSGLGLRSAEALAAKGARVLMACRNAAEGGRRAGRGGGQGHRPGARGRAHGPRRPRLGGGGGRQRRQLARPPRRPHGQRRRDGPPQPGGDEAGLRDAVRHEPPRPLRPHRSAPAAPARRRGSARGGGVVDGPPTRPHPVGRPELEDRDATAPGLPTSRPSWPTCSSPRSCPARPPSTAPRCWPPPPTPAPRTRTSPPTAPRRAAPSCASGRACPTAS